MATNREVLNQGIKKLAFALPALFTGPAVIYNAFINKQNNWHYLVLAIGIAICLTGVYLMFRGIQLIVKSMFDYNDDE